MSEEVIGDAGGKSGNNTAQRSGALLASDALLLPLSLAVLVALIVAVLWQARDPWLDEAMLSANLLTEDAAALFAPMARYDQATPLGHRVLGITFGQLAHAEGAAGAVLALRVLSAAAALIAAYFVYRTVRLFGFPAESVAVVLTASTTPVALRYATEIKHYMFEAAVTAALLYVAALASQPGARSKHFVVFAGVAAVGSTFSFTFPAVAAAFTAALFAVLLTRYLRSESPAGVADWLRAGAGFLRRYAFALAMACAALGAVLAVFLFYTRPITAINLAAYPDVYGAPPLAEWPSAILKFGRQMLSAFVPDSLVGSRGSRLLAGAAAGLMLIALFAGALRRSFFVATAVASLSALLLAAHLAGLFPAYATRHFVFVAPALACFIVLGAAEGAARLLRGRLAGVAPLLLGAYCLANGAAWLGHVKAEQVTPLIAHVAATAPEAPLWIYYSAQPAVNLLAPPTLDTRGRVSDASTDTGWAVRAGARSPTDIRQTDEGYLDSASVALRGADEAWLLFAHDREWDREAIVERVAAGLGPCVLALRAEASHLYRCRAAGATRAGELP